MSRKGREVPTRRFWGPCPSVRPPFQERPLPLEVLSPAGPAALLGGGAEQEGQQEPVLGTTTS